MIEKTLPRVFAALLAAAVFTVAIVVAPPASAKMEEWRDTQGNVFRAEPADLFGPLALFRVGPRSGRLVPLNLLTEEQCVRFHQHLSALPKRADDWGATKSKISYDLLGNVQRVENGKLVPVDLKGRREPELFILFFASNGTGHTWQMMSGAAPRYTKLVQEFPGAVEALYFGLRHKKTEHINMAVSMNVPWLVTDFLAQGSMTSVADLAPGEGGLIVVVSRNGVPLFNSTGENEAAVAAVMDQLEGFLRSVQPEAPKGWAARAHYQRAIRPVVHAGGRADPLLVGNPLIADGLRQRGIGRVNARIDVAADGGVANVTLLPASAIPEPMAAPLAAALKKSAVFAPAIENGKAVAGVYDYDLAVPPKAK